MRDYFCNAALVVVGLASATGAVAQEEWRNERVTWSEPCDSIAVTVENHLGDVRIRRSDDASTCEAVSHVQWVEGSVERPAFDLERTDGHLVVRVSGDEDRSLQRVDLALLVPRRTQLVIETVDGLIDVKGIEGDVHLETGSGDLRSDTSGAVWARSDRGAIIVFMRATAWEGESRIETVRSDIVVWLPPEAHVVATVETPGELVTDYSIEIERLGHDAQRKLGTARIGDGGRRLTLRTDRGTIKLRRNHF